MSAIDEVGIGHGDESLYVNNERFVADKRKYRISIVAWPGLEEGKLDLDANTPRFKKCLRHFIPGVGFVLNKGPEWTKLAGGPPQETAGTVIVVWPTDELGVLDPDILKKLAKKPEGLRIAPWIFGRDKYQDMAGSHREFHLGSHDVTLNCTEKKYQQISIQACKDSLLRKYAESDMPQSQKVWEYILSRIPELWDRLDTEFGRDLTLDQLREKMGGESAPPVTSGVVSDTDIDKMIGDLSI